MSYPGSFPGDPAGQQPGQTPGGFEYPPIDYGTPQPPVYSSPPTGYPPQVPPGAYPPAPPQYNAYNSYGAYNQYPPAYGGAPAATNGMAIGSLVSSLVGIPLAFLCFGFVASLVGIVLGIVALNQVKQSGQRGREMAIAGIALGGVGLVILLGWFALVGGTRWWL